jgi:hypothetical protein
LKYLQRFGKYCCCHFQGQCPMIKDNLPPAAGNKGIFLHIPLYGGKGFLTDSYIVCPQWLYWRRQVS